MTYNKLLVRVRLTKDHDVNDSPRIGHPRDIFNLIHDEMATWDREKFLCIIMNQANQILGINEVSVGSLTETLVHPREVFKPVFLMNGAAIMIAHNHLSGDPSPSSQDDAVSDRIKHCAELLGIRFVDSIIVAGGDFYSYQLSGRV